MGSLLCTENNKVHDKSKKETAVDLKFNEVYGIHGEPRDTPNDYDKKCTKIRAIYKLLCSFNYRCLKKIGHQCPFSVKTLT